MSRYAHQLAEAERRYANQRPLSQELHDRARAVMPGGSTRSVLDVRPFPFRVASAHGSRITDVDGHEYLDTLGDYSAGLLGHDAEPVAAAVRNALDTGWSYGGVHTDEIRFAEAIVDRFASIDRVRFTNSGTEANLMALQLARHHTGRDRVVVCDGAYHGGLLYFGAGGDALVAPFDITKITFNDMDGVDIIDTSVAAVLVEPMMGAAGCIPASTDFLAALRAQCDATGALLIFDEVMTSRMSAGGQQARVGIHPDLTTLGKYMAGGMTFGAFGGAAAVMDAFDQASGGTLTHGGTFNNNVVSMAAGVAALGEMLSPSVLDELFERGETLSRRLNETFDHHGVPLCVSGLGSMMNIHPSVGPITTPADVASGDPDLRQLVFHEFLHRGVYMAPRGYMALTLAFSDDDSDTTVEIADEVAAVLTN